MRAWICCTSMVFAYAPAQLVGTEFKEALYLPQSSPAYDEFNYAPKLGTTLTDFSDAYAFFWYFGCLKCFVIAYWMQKLLWVARGGSLVAQLIYMLLPMSALEAITHTTQNFISPWVHMAIFLFPGIYLARRRGTASESHSRDQVARPRIVERHLSAG